MKEDLLLSMMNVLVEAAPEEDKDFFRNRAETALIFRRVNDKMSRLCAPFSCVDITKLDEEGLEKHCDHLVAYPWERVIALMKNLEVEIDAFTAALIEQGYLKEEDEDDDP